MAITLNSASFLHDFNGNIVPRLAWARNIVFVDLQAANDWATNSSYYVEVELGVHAVGNIVPFPAYSKTLIEEPDQNGRLFFELQQLMQDYSRINIPAPDFNATQIEQHEAPTFYIKIYEVVDNVRTQIYLAGMRGYGIVGEYLVDAIDAALDRENFTYQQQFDWIFGDANEGGRKFLTSVEDPKSTDKKANEFLYFFASQPNRDLQVYSIIYYEDNTEESVILFDYMEGYHIQCIPTRYEIIKAKSTQPTKNIIAWGIYTGYNNFRISEFFRYELHEQYNREAKYFLAKNSLGVFDTLVCAGDYEDFLETEADTASKRDLDNYAITDAQNFIVSKTGKRGGTANTAFLNRLQSVVKQDFTLSREMFLQEKQGFIPIVAEKMKQVYSVKNNGLIGYSFEYIHAHNVKYYTNKIFRPILGEVPVPPELPKFTIKNTGSAGYVRVEYDSVIVNVAPNTEESIPILENVLVKVTWSVVNPDTLTLDANRISIAYPNYVFPARIDKAIFDSVVQTGNIVSGIPDENTIKKARSFVFTMPNNDYFAEVKFRDIEVIDFDFENPICVDNAANNTKVSTVKDTKNIYDSTNPTPSYRSLFLNNELITDRHQSGYGSFNKIADRNQFMDFSVFQTVLSVGKILKVPTSTLALPRANNIDQVSPANPTSLNLHFMGGWATTGSQGFGAVGFERDFGFRCAFKGSPQAGPSTPFLDITQNLNKDFYTRFAVGHKCKTRTNNTNYVQSNVITQGLLYGIRLLWSLSDSGGAGGTGGATLKRTLLTERLTANELQILDSKFEQKYNL